MTDSDASDAAIRARQYFQQGLAFLQRGQLAESVDAFRLALRTAPEHLEARLKLGFVLLKRGKAQEGLQTLEQGLGRATLTHEERSRLLLQASSCAAAVNQYDLARAYLERAMSLGGSPDPAILDQVAAICCKNGEFETGFDYFIQAGRLGSS